MSAEGNTAAMKRIVSYLAVLVLALAGCESISEATNSVRSKLAAREEGRNRSYAAPQRVTYQAVRTTAERMGYRILRGGAAQGFLEAVTTVGRGESNRSARQISMKVDLRSTLDEGTAVQIRLAEVLETESATRAVLATETPLQGTPQYEVFFRGVQQALDEQGAVEDRAAGK
jgi:hypothetical protein